MLSSNRAFELLYSDQSLRGAKIIVLVILSLVRDSAEALRGARFPVVLPIVGASAADLGHALVRIRLADEPIEDRFATCNADDLTFVARRSVRGVRYIDGYMDHVLRLQIRMQEDQLLVHFFSGTIRIRAAPLD
jgi:hypothetical protein